MTSRRHFLKGSLLTAAALSLKPLQSLARLPQATPAGGPVVLSTWRFGIQANAAAWLGLRCRLRSRLITAASRSPSAASASA